MDSSEDRLEIHRDVVALGKAFAVAFAVGLDVLAISCRRRSGTAPFRGESATRGGVCRVRDRDAADRDGSLIEARPAVSVA